MVSEDHRPVIYMDHGRDVFPGIISLRKEDGIRNTGMTI